jgi:bla regulator protein blaR1
MTEALINHLWQSTLCLFAAAALTLAFRRSGAHVRFLIWLAASVKFLIPFSLFVWIGRHVRWEAAPMVHTSSGLSTVVEQVTQPAAMMATNIAATPLAKAAIQSHWSAWTVILSIWLLGCIVLVCRRVYQWLYLRAVAEASSPVDIEAPIPVRETSSTLEPGIFGIFSPTLLVWWLGNRLIVERERACDEAVIQSGSDRHVYAEGILKVCQRYVAPPMCSAGVFGGTLRKRIEEIMTNPVLGRSSTPWVSARPTAMRCSSSTTG